MTASTLVMMLFSCPCSRERTSGEHNPARAHSIVCRGPTEIETIYRSHQDLLCKASPTAHPPAHSAIQAYPKSGFKADCCIRISPKLPRSQTSPAKPRPLVSFGEEAQIRTRVRFPPSPAANL